MKRTDFRKHIQVYELPCSSCEGSGKEPASYYGEWCYDCNGDGSFKVINRSEVVDTIRDALQELLREAKIKTVAVEPESGTDCVDNPAEHSSVEFARLLERE